MNKATLGGLAEDVFNDYRKNNYKTLPHIQIRFTRPILPFFGGRKRASVAPRPGSMSSLPTPKRREQVTGRSTENSAP